MENNVKVMEGINEELVNEVCEEVTKSSSNTLLKLGVGAVVVTAVGYGVYKLYKKVKNHKNETKNVDVENVVYEDEE